MAYVREGLLSEGYLRLRFEGLIFGGVGGGGGVIIGILREIEEQITRADYH